MFILNVDYSIKQIKKFTINALELPFKELQLHLEEVSTMSTNYHQFHSLNISLDEKNNWY